MRFSKGHGTENDFVLLPDPDGALDLTPALVAELCDRRRGIGGDGVLRVVRWVALGDGPAPDPSVTWFMDYRNADGSIAEMCGNGVRVFARYLATTGLQPGTEFPIGTRAGVRTVRFVGGDREHGDVAVDMGPARLGESSKASVAGQEFGGVAVDVGNPHLACVTDAPLAALDLTRAPLHDSQLFPEGVNVEFVSPLAGGEVRMRVHERGVGETRSCGTGTVAAAAAALQHAGRETGEVVVHILGGTVRVTIGHGTSTLQGPAVLVAHGEVTSEIGKA
ncbi:diaminopimelate epimerase [Pseudonocardia sp. TRM90224]|uniref:diaminopimelate epimerase n=1 Tax=Pseudonocardia sp. TRM90224 TaxID=2812678 RepID=UPI001E2A8FAC|nr:diaminopimelate epimerase [Pseudonocardia sp. TRM90224]